MRPRNSCNRQLRSIKRRKQMGINVSCYKEEQYAKQKVKHYNRKEKK